MRGIKMIIAPSILSMDFSQVNTQMDLINSTPVSWIHFDVMDGHFVPNLTFGPDLLRGISQLSDSLMDVHLMIDDPVKYAPTFIKAGADQITAHIECFETIEDLKTFIDYLKEEGVKVGLTSKPATPIDWILELINEVDTVLVMSVEPGFGGQSFMMDALDKIQQFDEKRKETGSKALIQVDGGINLETAKLVLEAGADVLVAGSYIFKGDIVKNIEALWELS